MSEMANNVPRKGTVRQSANGKWVATRPSGKWRTGVFPTEADAWAFLTDEPKQPKGADVFAQLTAQLTQLAAQLKQLREKAERQLEESTVRRGLKVGQQEEAKVVNASDLGLYLLPTPHVDPQVENEATIELRKELADAEERAERSHSWVDRERARQRVRGLRRELHYSTFDRPGTKGSLIGVEREPFAARQFAKPVPYTDRADVERRIERFERRTRS